MVGEAFGPPLMSSSQYQGYEMALGIHANGLGPLNHLNPITDEDSRAEDLKCGAW